MSSDYLGARIALECSQLLQCLRCRRHHVEEQLLSHLDTQARQGLHGRELGGCEQGSIAKTLLLCAIVMAYKLNSELVMQSHADIITHHAALAKPLTRWICRRSTWLVLARNSCALGRHQKVSVPCMARVSQTESS